MTENNFPVDLPGAKTRTLMWANEWEIEPQAVQQIRNVGALPWVDELRVMPDVHLGAGATIGTVIGSTSAICPSAVGVDIGCGMETVKISQRDMDFAKLDALIRSTIPCGREIRSVPHEYSRQLDLTALRCGPYVNLGRADKSIGTLGHFRNRLE